MKSGKREGLHVAIIMDGNGRWAARRGLPRSAGHRAGVAAVRRVVERAPDLGISQLTLYAFSSDNWRRPASEVQNIFWLLRAFLRLEAERLRQNGVSLQIVGRRDRLAESVLREIVKAENTTAAGRRLQLRIAIDYSSRDAIARAAASVAANFSKEECQPPSSLGPLMMRVLTAQGREVDLMIRTGGESAFRISCSGSAPMQNFYLRTRCGPTSTNLILKPRSTNSAAESAALGAYRQHISMTMSTLGSTTSYPVYIHAAT